MERVHLGGMNKKHAHHQYFTCGNKPKLTTRHLAALDFLLHIPMVNEIRIREEGMIHARKVKDLEEEKDEAGGENEDEAESGTETKIGNLIESASFNKTTSEGKRDENKMYLPIDSSAGKRLEGPNAPVGRFPEQLLYSMQRLSDQSAIVRQWEDQMLNFSEENRRQFLLSSRIFCSRQQSYPTITFSVIRYDAGEEKAKIEKLRADDQKGMEVFELPKRDWRGFSYKSLLKVTNETERPTSSLGEHITSMPGYTHDPNFIDDPAMLHGSHRYDLPRSAETGPMISSIILFVNKKDLKKSLNEQFRQRHPQLPPSLTLSRIRNIKKNILMFGIKIGIELSTMALAIINFERLCIKGIVTKLNRQLTMAVSLLLAMKFHETSPMRFKKLLHQSLEFFDSEWDLDKKQVFEAEFGAYVLLNFSLHVPQPHIYLVYTRLLKLLNQTSKQYLGDIMMEAYLRDKTLLSNMYYNISSSNVVVPSTNRMKGSSKVMANLYNNEQHHEIHVKDDVNIFNTLRTTTTTPLSLSALSHTITNLPKSLVTIVPQFNSNPEETRISHDKKSGHESTKINKDPQKVSVGSQQTSNSTWSSVSKMFQTRFLHTNTSHPSTAVATVSTNVVLERKSSEDLNKTFIDKESDPSRLSYSINPFATVQLKSLVPTITSSSTQYTSINTPRGNVQKKEKLSQIYMKTK